MPQYARSLTATGTHMPHGITVYRTEPKTKKVEKKSHSVICHSAEVTFPPSPQLKLVLDVATPEGSKTEFT